MSKNIEELRESGIACRGTITHVEWQRKSFSIQKSDRAKYRVRVEAPGREPFEIDVLYRHPAWSEGLKVDTTVPAYAHPSLDEAYLDFEVVDTMAAVDRALPKDDEPGEAEATAAEEPVEAPQQPAYENRLIGLPESDAPFNGVTAPPVQLDEPVPVSIAPSAATPVALLPEHTFERVDAAPAEPFVVASAAPVFATPQEAPAGLPVSEVAVEPAVPSSQPDEDQQPAADPFAPVQPISQTAFAPAPLPQVAPVAAIQQFAMPASEPVAAPTPFGSVFGEATQVIQVPTQERAFPAAPHPFIEVTPAPVVEASVPFSQQPFVLSQAIRGEAEEAHLEPVAEAAVEAVAAPVEAVVGQPIVVAPVASAPVAPPAPPAAVVFAAPPAPPVWHRDPSGRHELRYWDGVRWTEHVSSAGAQSVDPI